MRNPLIKISENEQEFEAFLTEIDEHFQYVINSRLRWKVTDLFISRGNNNIVIKFNFDTNDYVFRVPIHGRYQLDAVEKAARIFAGSNFFNRIIYSDYRCLIEPFVSGNNLGSSDNLDDFRALGSALSKIHSHSSEGFGWLKTTSLGVDSDIDAYFSKNIMQPWHNFQKSGLVTQNLTNFLNNFLLESISILKEKSLVVCHGDIWSNNVFYDPIKERIKIIDWDSIGSYSVEKDLDFLIDDVVSEGQKRAFVENYEFSFDMRLVYWYQFVKLLAYIFSHHRYEVQHLRRFLVLVNKIAVHEGFSERVDFSEKTITRLSEHLWNNCFVQE